MMRAIIEKRVTLEEKHKKVINHILENTVLDIYLARLWSHYCGQCYILVNNVNVTHSFNVWRDASLDVGQEIIIELVPKWRLAE